jgi:thiamine biosynthesis lipoprotein
MRSTRTFIEENERRFSRFLSASELSQINRMSGQWVTVSPEMLDVLRQAMIFYVETNGLFDPSILADLKRAGYDRTMDEVRLRAGESLPTSGRTRRGGFNEVEWDSDRRQIRLPKGLELDLGGIAKGWIVQQAAQLLSGFAEVNAVNAGGDMFFIGHPPGQSAWTVYLEDPRNTSTFISQLEVKSGAVATSSILKRSWMQGEVLRHHLIDPRTGVPAQTRWLSATVIAPDLAVAEVYAKTILIGGPDALETFEEKHPEANYLIVDDLGNVNISPRLQLAGVAA